MFGKWTQVQTYGKVDKSKYIKKNHPQIWQNIEIPPLVRTSARPQISEYIRSKGTEEKESLLLKGNFVCLPKWQEVQSNFGN